MKLKPKPKHSAAACAAALALCLAALSGLLSLRAAAADAGYHWYCVHVRGHVQPRAAAELQFVEELDGYYIDHNHTAQDDPDRVVYLTFDAGYENGNVARVLDVLKQEEVPAAFFILGNLIRHDTDLVRRMAAEGHTVCNHTVRHKDMSRASDEDFLAELRELEELYRQQTGGELSRYYRPPEGSFSRQNLACAQANGYKTVFWSFAYPDWDNNRQMPPEKAKQIILDNLHNGEVLLLHPTSEVNAQILGDVIRELKEQGYRFGTLDELTASGHAAG